MGKNYFLPQERFESSAGCDGTAGGCRNDGGVFLSEGIVWRTSGSFGKLSTQRAPHGAKPQSLPAKAAVLQKQTKRVWFGLFLGRILARKWAKSLTRPASGFLTRFAGQDELEAVFLKIAPYTRNMSDVFKRMGGIFAGSDINSHKAAPSFTSGGSLVCVSGSFIHSGRAAFLAGAIWAFFLFPIRRRMRRSEIELSVIPERELNLTCPSIPERERITKHPMPPRQGLSS